MQGWLASWERYQCQLEPVLSHSAAGNPCIAIHCSWRENCSDEGGVLTEWKTTSWTSSSTKALKENLPFRSLKNLYQGEGHPRRSGNLSSDSEIYL